MPSRRASPRRTRALDARLRDGREECDARRGVHRHPRAGAPRGVLDDTPRVRAMDVSLLDGGGLQGVARNKRFILIYAMPFLSIRNASSRVSLHPGRRSRPRAPTIAANVSSPRTKGRVPHDAPPRAGCAYLAAVARTISPRGLTAVHDARARAFDRRAPGEPFALTRRKTRSAAYPIPSRGSARCPRQPHERPSRHREVDGCTRG